MCGEDGGEGGRGSASMDGRDSYRQTDIQTKVKNMTKAEDWGEPASLTVRHPKRPLTWFIIFIVSISFSTRRRNSRGLSKAARTSTSPLHSTGSDAT